MINIQPISKRDHHPDHSLLVHSLFYTIQGEGPLTGHPAIFIRLAGCNLQCPLCDTEYTEGARRMSPEEIVKEVRALHEGPRLVVITGGEPFRQAIGLLTQLLEDNGYQIQIETNGSLPPPDGLAATTWIVCSPKTTKINEHTRAVAVAFKYVLSHDSVSPVDGLPLRALGHAAGGTGVARPPSDFLISAIYVQPADHHDSVINQKNLQAVLNTCMRFGYTLQLQVHKILNME